MKINTEVDGLLIREPSQDEVMRISQESGVSLSGLTAFVVESSSFKGYIVATDIAMTEDNGDYKTPSSLLIGS